MKKVFLFLIFIGLSGSAYGKSKSSSYLQALYENASKKFGIANKYLEAGALASEKSLRSIDNLNDTYEAVADEVKKESEQKKAIAEAANARAQAADNSQESLKNALGILAGQGVAADKSILKYVENVNKQNALDIAANEKAQAELTEASRLVEAAEAKLTSAEIARGLKLKSLENRIKLLTLKDKFSDIADDYGAVDKAMDDIVDKYDKTVMGAYVQDKIGMLLNSQVICSAQKRCSKSDESSIPGDRIRRELFPASDKSRYNYYYTNGLETERTYLKSKSSGGTQ